MVKGKFLGLVSLILVLGFCLGGCEKMAFKKARKKNTVESFKKYLDKYPYSENAGLAQYRIETIAFREVDKGKRKIGDYKKFIEEYPESKFSIQAKRQVLFQSRKKTEKMTLEKIAAARIIVETSMGEFMIRLFPDKAPEHCRNLIALAYADFYNGIKVSWVEPDRMIRMGDPRGDGLGGPGYMLKREINDKKHVRGIVSMWHLDIDPNTAGSQFFICLNELTDLDGVYTVFGEVVEGMQVIDEISKVEITGKGGRRNFYPRAQIFMQRLRIEGIEIE